MGRRILDVVAPELAEEQERKALEAEEQAASDRVWLTGRRRGDGRTRVVGDIPDAVWDRVVTCVEPYLSPRQPGQEPDNHLAPSSLSRGDQRHLRDAFGIIRSAQTALLRSHPALYYVS